MQPAAHNRFPKLAHYLRCWCQGDTGDEVSRYLVGAAASFARQYLRRRLLAASLADEVALDSVAISASAELFEKNRRGSPLCEILRPHLEDDCRLIHAFTQYSLCVIKNALHGHIKELDPAGFKLSDRIKEALDNDRYTAWPDSHLQFVRLTTTTDLNPSGKPWTAQDIMRVACQVAATDSTDTPRWVAGVMAIVSNSPGYQNFVEIEILKSGLRMANASLFPSVNSVNHVNIPLDPATRTRLHKHVEESRIDGHAYLDNYKRQDKLGDGGLEILHRAFDAYVDDIQAHGQPRQSQFDYAAEQMPGLTLWYYQGHFKSAFEGAISLFWKRFGDFTL